LSVVSFLAFCNLSIFYGFNAYLGRLGIAPEWRGVLLALEPGTAFLLRPVISPLLHLGNGVRIMGLGLAAIMAALAGYPLATGAWPRAALRVLHGAGFVALVSAAVAVLVHYVPKERSGQGFGVFSIMTLLPYAVVPPLVERFLPALGNEALVYCLAAPLFLPAFLLLIPLGRKSRALAATLPRAALARPGPAEMREDLGLPGVASLLLANLLLFTATTVVFFFMKDYGAGLGLANPGLFFSLSTGATILVRVAAGPFFDRVNKAAVLAALLPVLGLCLLLFGRAGSPAGLLVLAGGYGLCLGVVMPQLNAAMFVISPARLRGLNTNLMLFTMDGGYWLGPLAGGFLLGKGWSFPELFTGSAALAVAAGILVLPVVRLTRTGRAGPAKAVAS
jgi:MFS family permease